VATCCSAGQCVEESGALTQLGSTIVEWCIVLEYVLCCSMYCVVVCIAL